MVSVTQLKDTLGIVAAAGQILDNKTVRKVVSTSAKATIFAKKTNKVGGALTQFTQQTTIISRVFIEDTITNEIVLPNLMKSVHEWYAAQVVAALQLSRLVDGKRTLQNIMSVVQDGRHDRTQDVMDEVLKKASGMEAFLSNYLGEAGMEAIRPTPFVTLANAKKELSGPANDTDQVTPVRNTKPVDSSITLRSVSASENKIGPMGELFEITLAPPTDKSAGVKIPIFIQMQPTIVPADIAPRFIDMNVAASTWQRWTQMKAGEISFFKDFVLGMDLARRNLALLKNPEAASALSEFMKTTARKDKYALGDAMSGSDVTRSANLANSVVILSEETVAQAKADSAIDLHNDQTRARYLRDTYAMILIIVDTIHQRVTIYFNSLDGSLNCGYGDFKPKDTKFDPNDFMQALTAFSTNSIGRMR